MIDKKTFVEINFTGKLPENDVIFDTTVEKIAKENGLFQQDKSYKPAVVCVGNNQVLPGIDKALIGKKDKESFTVIVPPEDGFGKKNAKLIELIPMRKFKEQNLNPVPGMQVYVDDRYGVVKMASAGRIYVDFNHPFSGKELVYDVEILRIVEDLGQKVESLISSQFPNTKTAVNGKDATVTFPKGMPAFPAEVGQMIEKSIKEIIPELNSVTFAVEGEEKKAPEAKPTVVKKENSQESDEMSEKKEEAKVEEKPVAKPAVSKQKTLLD